jgi:hypothetical protein
MPPSIKLIFKRPDHPHPPAPEKFSAEQRLRRSLRSTASFEAGTLRRPRRIASNKAISALLTFQRRTVVWTIDVPEGLKFMAKAVLQVVSSVIENRTVAVAKTPRRLPNAELRTREYLTPAEVDLLLDAAKRNRWG